MRELALFGHIILGAALVVLPIVILNKLKGKYTLVKQLSFITAAISWIMLLPAGILYINFYPVTKSLIKAGAWPWAHLVIMEAKEHWGLLLPIVATIAAGLVLTGKVKESRRWWILLMILSALIAVMGRIIKMGAIA